LLSLFCVLALSALFAVFALFAPCAAATPAHGGAGLAGPGPATAASAANPWLEAGRPGPQAAQAIELLADAASHGLDPLDYGVPALREAWVAAQGAGARAEAPATATADRLARALDDAMRRYLADLHDGRVAPAAVNLLHPLPERPPFDAAAALREALAARDLPAAVRRAAPALAQYERLREALARYRTLAGHRAWAQPLPALPLQAQGRARKPALEPGQPWAGLPMLAARLQALGDLGDRGQPAPDPGALDDTLVAAVQQFQARHGLAPDGVVGRATWTALQVAPAARVRQLELALERLRWTPLVDAPRRIVVNVPEFVLRAYEVHGGRVQVRATMKVIVGRALETRTPLIHGEMRTIEFQPFWNVPPSIARKELVPRLRRSGGAAYWAREGFEFVGGGGAPDATLDAARLDAVMVGRMRIRQRPGPHNALGDIKFVFPNRESIFLHHTPATALFERARRDFSHGCIRVEQPVALALFALQGLPGWDEARVRRAMESDPPSTVAMAQPVPVLIAYGTALVKAGQVHFFDDIYGHDRALDEALRRRAVQPAGAAPAGSAQSPRP
jgi:murein L,D-transpeptidase YcbB/YkuD